MNKESLLEACAAAVNVYRLDTSWASVLELDQTSWSITFLGRDWCIFCCPGQSCPTRPPCYLRGQMLATRAYVDEFEATEMWAEKVLWCVTVVKSRFSKQQRFGSMIVTIMLCVIIRVVHSQSQPYVHYIVVWTLILDTQAIEVLAMCSWRMASK